MSENKTSKLQAVRDRVADVYAAHKDVVSVKNVGSAIGFAAGKVAIVGLKFYDGLYQGFHQKERNKK